MGEWKEEKTEAERIFFSSVYGGSVEVGALIHKVLVQIFQNIFVQTVEEKSGFGGGACPAPNPAAEAPQSLARGPAALTPNVPHTLQPG